ncbi:MAG: trehalase family glycosidase [Dehalococcoidia bacterium]|nr:trehalase family glycosidase [Dehalococcoidia bacterium]MDW8119446.1 trehalase family glycosidase [Chloroflexota bacterium]
MNAVYRRIRSQAQALLLSNRRQGYDRRSRRTYRYTCPSPGRYRWQWFWDSCFHAIVLSHWDLEQAKAELVSLVSLQEGDGFIGHVLYWGPKRLLEPWAYLQSSPSLRPRHTRYIQPPVLAQAVKTVFQRSGDRAFLREMVPPLDRYYRWLARERDPDGDGLISIISPYESGLDHKPAYDPLLGIRNPRPPSRTAVEWRYRLTDLVNLVLRFSARRAAQWGRFEVEDVLVNAIYAQGLYAVADLHRALGESRAAEQWRAQAQRVEQAILTKCYDPSTEAYFDLAGRAEKPLRTLTITALFPLILPSIPPERVRRQVERHVKDPQAFWAPYPLPTVSMAEPSFAPDMDWLLWRGPTWMNTNWFLVKALRRHGYRDEADAITEKSVALVEREGFREFYNPLTGKGMGAHDFGWTTLVVDMVEGGEDGL